jgi:hypothetical protein
MEVRTCGVLSQRQHRLVFERKERIHPAPAHALFNDAPLERMRLVIADPAEPAETERYSSLIHYLSVTCHSSIRYPAPHAGVAQLAS